MANLRSVGGANPAANVEVSETVPAGVIWVPLSVTVANVQAAAGSSQPVLVLDDGTNTLFEMFGATAAQAVSTTCRYTWAAGGPAAGAIIGATTNQRAVSNLPKLPLPAGHRIRTVTIGLSANTDFGAPQLLVIELSHGDRLSDYI